MNFKQLSPFEQKQYLANMVELHGQLGTYQDFLVRTGFIEPETGNFGEMEALELLLKGIEKRADDFKRLIT